MKKSVKILTITFLFIGMTALMGCKKEVQIEKNLYSKGGEWSIVKYQNNYGFGGNSDSYALYNAGTYKFEKDGTGKITITQDGETFSNLFTYNNTVNSLTLVFKEGPMYYENDTEKYTLDWKKDKINLYSYKSTNDSYDEYLIDIEKK